MPKPAHQQLAHFESLLKRLPHNLPYKPATSCYMFEPDKSELEDRGVFGVAVHCLEIAFQTHALKLQGTDLMFSEHGPRLTTDLMKLLRWTIQELPSEEQRQAFCKAWVLSGPAFCKVCSPARDFACETLKVQTQQL
jgi:hypothetical protein